MKKSPINPLVYELGQSLCRILLDAGFRLQANNVSAVPQRGPFILASNHASFLDPPVLGAPLSRQIHYLARDSLFEGVGKWILPRVGSLPVARGKGDVSAVRVVLDILKAGEGVVLFPEGTRSPDGSLQPAKPGVGLIACRAQVPVVPARIFGSFEAFNRTMKFPNIGTRVQVTYGHALSPKEYDPGTSAGKGRSQKAAEQIMEAIQALRPVR